MVAGSDIGCGESTSAHAKIAGGQRETQSPADEANTICSSFCVPAVPATRFERSNRNRAASEDVWPA